MRILIEINTKLPALLYGGSQRVVWDLAKELSAMGHDITLLALKGSYCPFAKVIEIDPSLPRHRQIPDDIDVVHFNNDADPLTPKPYIVTIHGNKVCDNSLEHSVFVSKNHAQRHGSQHFVYNGSDWSNYGDIEINHKREHFHFLGKAAWKVKNIRGAIRITKSLEDEKLMVLGGYRLNFKMGFRFTLSPKIKFYGMVGDQTKREVISRSKGLIFPVLWDEPFGLAITESLYLGAPVYGSQRGSLPELVAGDVGFLSNQEDEIAHAIRGAEFSPQRCHEYARDLFNSRLMAERYVEKYERVINHGKL